MIATKPDDRTNSVQLRSDSSKQYTNPMYFDAEGYNSIRSPWEVDNITKQLKFPKQDIVFEVYADSKPPVTKINYAVPRAEFVTIKIFDILGREVSTLVNGKLEAGYYTFDFDATSLSSGVYLYKMNAGSFEKTMRLVVVK